MIKKNGLGEFVAAGELPLKVLFVESAEYIVDFRQKLPNAEFYAVTRHEEVAELAELTRQRVNFTVADFRLEKPNYPEGFFDIIVAAPVPTISYEPYDTLMALNRLLAETGFLLTHFWNVRYHGVINALAKGEFPYRSEHLYAKGEMVRLLNDTLYKEIVFTPLERDDDESIGEALAEVGFANFSADLSTRRWMLKASRSKSEVAALKSLYTPEVRKRIGRLLHRIEYEVETENSAKELFTLAEQEFIFPDYIADFAREITVNRERMKSKLISCAKKMGREDFASAFAEI